MQVGSSQSATTPAIRCGTGGACRGACRAKDGGCQHVSRMAASGDWSTTLGQVQLVKPSAVDTQAVGPRGCVVWSAATVVPPCTDTLAGARPERFQSGGFKLGGRKAGRQAGAGGIEAHCHVAGLALLLTRDQRGNSESSSCGDWLMASVMSPWLYGCGCCCC